MQLDFITLYVIILLNSISFAVVWVTITRSYRSMRAARFWLAALIMTCISGPLLFSGESGGLVAFAGLALVSGSFATMWQGLRVFFGYAFSGSAVLAIMIGTMAGLLTFGSNQEAINLTAAISLIFPVALAVVTLWHTGSRSAGARIAITAALIVILGQVGEAITNGFRLMGMLSSASYYDFAAWFLVCAIIGGSMWNLGFLLMSADRLRSNLVDLATSDDLTGLANRRGLRERMLLYEKSARRKNMSVVLMMIDLDKFKSINDRHGHAAGDAALVHIAELARDILRDNDVVARVGGDEFCVLLPNIGKIEAGKTAKRLINAIKGTPLHWKGRDIQVSASVGVTEWRPGGALTLFESLEHADELMFEIKKDNHSALAA